MKKPIQKSSHNSKLQRSKKRHVFIKSFFILCLLIVLLSSQFPFLPASSVNAAQDASVIVRKVIPQRVIISNGDNSENKNFFWENGLQSLQSDVSEQGVRSEFWGSNSAELIFHDAPTSSSPTDATITQPQLLLENLNNAANDIPATTTQDLISTSTEDSIPNTTTVSSAEINMPNSVQSDQTPADAENNQSSPPTASTTAGPSALQVLAGDIEPAVLESSATESSTGTIATAGPEPATSTAIEEAVPPAGENNTDTEIQNVAGTADAAQADSNKKIYSPGLEFSNFSPGASDQEDLSSEQLTSLDVKISFTSLPVLGASVHIEYALGTSTWQSLETIALETEQSNGLRGGYATASLPAGLADRLDDIKLRLVYSASAATLAEHAEKPLLDIDALWVEENYEKTFSPDIADDSLDNLEVQSPESFSHIDFLSNLLLLSMPSDLANPITLNSSSLASTTLQMLMRGVSTHASSTREGNTITYADAFPNTDLQYEAQATSLKENIILKSSYHPRRFVYQLNFDTYDYVVNGSTVVLYKKGHKNEDLYQRYIVSAPVMTDASGATSSAISISVSGNILTLTPDAPWLLHAKYPVIVDPTISITVLNVHSHPIAGENWNIDFVTSGTADLTVTPADQSTIDDMQFQNLMCGSEDKTPGVQQQSQGVLFYPNWACDGIATVSFLDLKTGNHHMVFNFGGQTADAYNSTRTWSGAGGNTLWDNTGNWGGGIVPTSGDLAVFDGSCGGTCNATVNTTTSVGGISLAAGYTGTVTQVSTSTLTIGSSNFSVASGTWVSSASTTNTSITVNGSFSQTGGSFTAPAGTMRVMNNMTLSSGIFNHNSGTIQFYDNSNVENSTITCSGTPFNTIVLNKVNGTNFFPNTVTVSAGCTVPLGASPTTNTSADPGIVNNGTITVASGTWTYTGYSNVYNNGTITHNGNGWVSQGGLVQQIASSTVSYSGTTASFMKDLNVATGTFPTGLTITIGDYNNNQLSTITCNGNPFGKIIFNKANGTSFFPNNVTIASGCTVPLGASPTSQIDDSSHIINNGTITISSGTWTYNGHSDITNNGVITHNGNGWISVGGLVQGSTGVVTYAGTSASFGADLNIATGTFPSGLDITLTDNGVSSRAGSLTSNTSVTFSSLTISKSGFLSGFTLGSNATTGNFTVSGTNGISNPGSPMTIAVSGNFSQTAGTLGGSNLTVLFASSTASTISGAGGIFASSLQINKTGNGSAKLISTFASSGSGTTCSVNSGTFDINGNNFACGSAFTVASGSTLTLMGSEATVTTPSLASGSTVLYKGNGNSIADTVTQFKNWSYSNLSINTIDAGDTIDGSGVASLTIPGNFSLLSGNFIPPTTYNVAGNVLGAGGTVSSGTVVLNGTNQQILGTSTFFNLTKNVASADTLTFGASSLVTVNGTMNLQGAAGQPLSLRSSQAGTQWLLNPVGSRTISYLDVKDSDNIGITILTKGFAITDSGNNTGWAFSYLDQQQYQFYNNADNIQPGGVIGLLSSTTTLTTTSSPIRLRANLQVTNQNLAALTSGVKLQVAASPSGVWITVPTSTSLGLWWNINWGYRKSITVTNNTTTALTNFQVQIPVTYNANMKTDFSDIRFTNASQTPLNYWIETYATSSSATAWVQVDAVPGSASSTIYMYYGNAGATSSSSIGSTFVFGDDFNGTTTIDTGKWAITNSTGWSVANGELKGTDTTGRLTSVPTFSSPNILEVKYRYITNPSNGFMAGGFFLSTSNCFGFLNSPGPDFYRNDGGWTGLNNVDPASTNLLLQISVKNSSAVNVSLTNYNTLASYQSVANVSNTVLNEPIALGERYDNAVTGQAYEAYWDWVRVRKYASADPSVSTGAETNLSSVFSYFNFYDNPSVTSTGSISSLLLPSSNVGGTYMEGNLVALNPNLVSVGQFVEYDFALSPQSLVSGTYYYFRLTRNDGQILDTYTNYPTLLFLAESAPNSPSSLGPSSLTSGVYTNTAAPTFAFNLTDSDGADTVKYEIQISTSSSFSTKVIDYVSALGSQGARSFAIGQAAGGGSYISGSSATTLPDTSSGYYWRVYAIDNSGAFSSSTVANSGAVAFKVDTVAPTPGILSASPAATSSIAASLSGASDALSGLAAAPYVFYNASSNTNSSATSSASWTTTGLLPNTQYTFYASTTDAAGNSATTANVSTYTLANTPTSTVATANSNTQITLSWNANSNPAGTEYFPVNQTASTSPGWITSTSAAFSSLTCNTSYSFNIKARNGNSVETATTTSVSATTAACASSNNNGGGSGGGGGSVMPPNAGYSVLINNNASVTNTSLVTLTFTAPPGIATMKVSNSSALLAAPSELFTSTKQWNICPQGNCAAGTYFVYVEYFNAGGSLSSLALDDIYYDPGTAVVSVPPVMAVLASLDHKTWLTPLKNVAIGQQVSLEDLIPTSLVDKNTTISFDCESDGVYERTVQSVHSTSVTARNLCTYPKKGTYAATAVLEDGVEIYAGNVVIQVGKTTGTPLPPITTPPSTTPPVVIVQPPVNPPAVIVFPSTTTPPLTAAPPAPPASGENGGSSSSSTAPGALAAIVNSGIEAWHNTVPAAIALLIDPINKVVTGTSSFAGTPGAKMLGETFFATHQMYLTVTAEDQPLQTIARVNTVTVAPSAVLLQYFLVTGGMQFKASSLTDFWYWLLQMLNGFLTAIGFRKRRRYWGTVYDSVSKQPIDPAMVTLHDPLTGKVIEQAITDIVGRYGFLERAGIFKIRVRKTSYAFPSTVIAGKSDGVFENVYHGEAIVINRPEDVISPNIPMDPVAFDWNQKDKQKIVRFNTGIELLVFYALQILFWMGGIWTFLQAMAHPTAINIVFLCIYVLLFIIQRNVNKNRLAGFIKSSTHSVNGLLIEARFKNVPSVVLGKAVTNEVGKFFLKLPKGEFTLQIKDVEGETAAILYEMPLSLKRDGVVNIPIHID